jgi:Natural resistance-associated macrophage protein
VSPKPPHEADTAVALPLPLGRRKLPRGPIRRALPYLGPAFVASVAYVDPGNFATNISGGAAFGYLLLWVIFAANLMGMLIHRWASPPARTSPSCAVSASRARSPGGCGGRPR